MRGAEVISQAMPVRVRSRGLRRRAVRHADLSWRAQAMLEALGLEDAELSVLLCSDEEIRQLNRRYRRKDKSTDVLAFPMQELPFRAPAGALLGDVVISLPTATRQAAEGDRPIIEEVTFLLAHGLLHLLGYDHATKRQEREMTERIAHLLASVEDARR
jgi:probable rRNA maturation factor